MALSQGKMITFLLLAGLLQSASAATYTVGDSLGWTFPPSPTFYDDWAANHTFLVGDELVFRYNAPEHDVFEVSEADVTSCSRSNTIEEWTRSNVTLTLESPGYHGYICSLTSHCEAGMKMNVQVSPAADEAPTTEAAAEGPAPATTSGGSRAFTLQSGSAVFFGRLAAGCLVALLQ